MAILKIFLNKHKTTRFIRILANIKWQKSLNKDKMIFIGLDYIIYLPIKIAPVYPFML